MHYLDLLPRCPWPEGRINLTHSGAAHLFLQRRLISLLQSLVLSSTAKEHVPMLHHLQTVFLPPSETFSSQPPLSQGCAAPVRYDTSLHLACQRPPQVILGRPDSAELETSLSQRL